MIKKGWELWNNKLDAHLHVGSTACRWEFAGSKDDTLLELYPKRLERTFKLAFTLTHMEI